MPEEATESTESETAEADTSGGAESTEAAESSLGDAGKKALDRMKAERNAVKADLAAYKALGLDPDALKALIGKSEDAAKAAETERARREAESAALSKANERLVRAEIKAAATGKLTNPALALKLLDLSSFDVNDDGEVDTTSIASAIEDLIKNEPYLGVTQGDAKRFQGTGDSGPRGTAGKPQLTEQDVKRLSKEGKHGEIEAARLDGRLNNLLGIK